MRLRFLSSAVRDGFAAVRLAASPCVMTDKSKVSSPSTPRRAKVADVASSKPAVKSVAKAALGSAVTPAVKPAAKKASTKALAPATKKAKTVAAKQAKPTSVAPEVPDVVNMPDLVELAAAASAEIDATASIPPVADVALVVDEGAEDATPPESVVAAAPVDSLHAALAQQQADAEQADAVLEEESEEEEGGLVQEPRFWQDDGWTAKVMKNEDDDGWAVAMTLDGEPEPALVGPWTMGRDKKNPKPLDANAFSVLVKTAYEVRRRHEQQLHAMLHKSLTIDNDDGRIKITLQIVPDEYEPHAILSAFDEYGDAIAEVRVEAHFKLNNASAHRWIENDFRRPGGD